MTAAAIALLAAPPARADDKQGCAEDSLRGQEARDAGRLLEARAIFVSCSAERCPLAVRRDCAQWLDGLSARVPGIVISARDSEGHDVVDVRVLVDGKPFLSRLDGRATPVDPGVHLFRFEPNGAPAFEERVLVREGEQSRLLTVKVPAVAETPTPPPPTHEEAMPHETAPSRPVTWPTFVLAGGGVLAIGGFAILASVARSDVNDLRSTCGTTQPPSCAQSDVDSVHRELIVANVALGVGVLALAGAAWLFFQRGAQGR
jgi:hypothetical protein